MVSNAGISKQREPLGRLLNFIVDGGSLGRNVVFLSCYLLLIMSEGCFLGCEVMPSKAEERVGAFESHYLKALQHQQPSSYAHQQALQHQTAISQTTVDVRSQQQILLKNIEMRSFSSAKNAGLGTDVANTPLSTTWSGSQKQIGKKIFPTAHFFTATKKIAGTVFVTHDYPTKVVYPLGKTQGRLDHELQQALQQKKSPGEVREMLEKSEERNRD